MQKLLLKTKISRIEGTIIRFFQKISKPDLFILNDFGPTHLGQQQQLDLIKIIENQHGKSSTLITSQLSIANWYDVPGEETIG